MSQSSVQMRRSPATEHHRRRRVAGGARVRRRRSSSSSGARSGPATPLLQWKLDGAETAGQSGTASPAVVVVPSARKLGASIWRLGFEADPTPSNVQKTKTHDQLKTINHSKTKDVLHNYISHENEMYVESPHSTTETATKWDSTGHVQSFYQQKLLEYKPSISSVNAELDEARARVSELEAERRHTRKKIDYFMRKIQEEKAAWRSREHEKIRNIIESMKDEIGRERKNRNRLEILNSKLVNELTEAKLTAKRCSQDYEKERKARELMEEVCDELAKEIADDKSEAEALKSELIRTREEIEEERKMLQMAEVWREERVQMKLVDAKLTLESKYKELVGLKSILEAYVRSNLGSNEEREARVLIEAVNKVKVGEIREFKYQKPRESEDIFSVFEELRPQEEEREINQCYGNNDNDNGYSSESRGSRVNTMSPDTDIFLERREKEEEERENESGWETVSNLDEHGSSNSNEGSEPSVNNVIYNRNKSINESISGTGTGTDWDEKSEVCSNNNNGKPSNKKKGSKIMRIWRSNNEDCKKSNNNNNNSDLVSIGRVSNASDSPDLKSGVLNSRDLKSGKTGQLSSPESVNPHVKRGMNGFVEWKKGKQSLKSKLMDVRVEGKKLVQLKQALKQKI
ncbi:hypothetical protein LUZ60_000935 [Juncus effusus]|nr:hypothetical protein LUZ60_000935 [Juncus effusus]